MICAQTTGLQKGNLSAYGVRMLSLFQNDLPTNIAPAQRSDQGQVIQRYHVADDAAFDRLRSEVLSNHVILTPSPTAVQASGIDAV